MGINDMRFRLDLIALVCLLGTAAVQAQSGVEYTRKLNGSIDVNALGEVTTYTLQPAGIPSIDQTLGNLVETWSFKPVIVIGVAKPVKAEFVINLARTSLADTKYTVRRVEFYPENLKTQTRRASSADELAYCRNPQAQPSLEIICPATVPFDAAMESQGVGAEAYIAIRRTEAGPEVALDGLSLFTATNVKVSNKAFDIAKEKYSQEALRYGQINAAAMLQDKDVVMARVELVQANNKTLWRRQDKIDLPKVEWLTDAMRQQTVYVGQGVLERK
jgi:hypothetical protein